MRWSNNVEDFVPEAELEWYESVSHAKAIQKFRAWHEAGCPKEKDDEDNEPKRSSPLLRWDGVKFVDTQGRDGRTAAGASRIPGIDLEDSEPE